MSHTSHHTYGSRISDEWTLQGMRAAVLENELLRVLVLLDRGAEILEFRYKPLDVDPLLRLPGGIRNPARDMVSVASRAGNFLDYYVGGWQEILPNGGPQSMYKGAEYGQHGEICLTPWSAAVVEDSPERVSLRCQVRAARTPLFLERTMTLLRNQAALFLDERLTNEGGEQLDLMWGHHIAFGAPFLNNGAVLDTSARSMVVHEAWDAFAERRLVPDQHTEWPIALARSGGQLDMSRVPAPDEIVGSEMVYLSDFGDAAWYALTNPVSGCGFGINWDAGTFPYLWLWQEFGAGRGFPWWKRTYAMALEPWTSFPTLGLPEAVSRGTQLTLAPRETRSTRLVAVAYTGIDRVSKIGADGSIQPSATI